MPRQFFSGSLSISDEIFFADIKPNYTAKQNQIADWIKGGHDAEIIRANSKTRCYITTGLESHWYGFVKAGPSNPNTKGRPTELPDGNFQVFGNKPGGPTTTNNSRFCGTVIYSRERNTGKGKKNNRPINS